MADAARVPCDRGSADVPQGPGIALIVAGGVRDLADMLALFLISHFGRQVNTLLVIPPTIAETWMALYLLVKGVRSSARHNQVPING